MSLLFRTAQPNYILTINCDAWLGPNSTALLPPRYCLPAEWPASRRRRARRGTSGAWRRTSHHHRCFDTLPAPLCWLRGCCRWR